MNKRLALPPASQGPGTLTPFGKGGGVTLSAEEGRPGASYLLATGTLRWRDHLPLGPGGAQTQSWHS